MAVTGLCLVAAQGSASEALERALAAIAKEGLHLAAHIDHAAAAAAAGLALRPRDLLIFGNPKVGTPLMAALPTAALDLPLRLLIYEDNAGAAWIAHDAPAWIAGRHGGAPQLSATIEAMAGGLTRVAKAAAGHGATEAADSKEPPPPTR